MRISEITPDGFVIQMNDYEVNKMKGVYKIDKEENYSDATYLYTQSEIETLYNDGVIYDISR